MGFGLLFLGYTVTYILRLGMGDYAFGAILLGSFLTYLAFSKLKEYYKLFAIAEYLSIVMILMSVWMSFAGINRIFDLGFDLSLAEKVLDFVRYALECAQTVIMLVAISGLALEVELPKHSSRAKWNIVFVAINYIYMFALPLFIGNITSDNDVHFFESLSLFFHILCAVFNAVLLFLCYMYICDENDKDMKRKPSKISFVNKMREKRDAKEEKAIAEAQEYIRRRKEAKERKGKKR